MKTKWTRSTAISRRDQIIYKTNAVYVLFDQCDIIRTIAIKNKDRSLYFKAMKINKLAKTLKRSRYPFCPYYWTSVVERLWIALFNHTEPFTGETSKQVMIHRLHNQWIA